MRERTIHLSFHGSSAGEHLGAWRASAGTGAGQLQLDYYVQLAQTAERGLFDDIFYASGLALHDGSRGRDAAPGLDPVVLAAVLAARTSRIGLVATVSTTFNEPYNVAKAVASLDHVSAGRAAWNIVTTYDDAAARNFGMQHLPPKELRYNRAAEFVDVVLGLWGSWKTGSLTTGATGTAVDASRIAPIAHAGRHYSVQGPAQTPPSPQGRPILFQAGASEDGKAFATRYADGIFTVALDLAIAQTFYAEMKSRIAANGRNPDDVNILPGIYLYIGSTEAEAHRALEDHAVGGSAIGQLAVRLNAPVELLKLDEGVDSDILDRAGANPISQGHSASMIDVFRRERLTVREFLARQPVRGPHRVVCGTPEQVAATLAEWFTARAADGFNIGNLTHAGLEIFVDHVVPLLQRRHLYRKEYTGTTLRENFIDRSAVPET